MSIIGSRECFFQLFLAQIFVDWSIISCLFSVLNSGTRVLNRDHNFLVGLAGTFKENDPNLISDYRKVRERIEEIEREGYTLSNDQKYTVSFDLCPVDIKFLAIVCGELTNSSFYPSSFSATPKEEISSHSAGKMRPWDYEKRLADTKKVDFYKTSNKSRAKITQFIVKLKSRQEYSPSLGTLVQ